MQRFVGEVGVFLNERLIEGFQGFDLNNHGAALLVSYDPNDQRPYYWDGSAHPIGDEFGFPLSLNDNDEILVLQYNGRSILWRKTVGASGVVAFIPTDLGELTGLDIVYALQINNAGQILLAAWNAQHEIQAYLLIPKSDRLGVDFDRDGVIDTSRDAANPDREFARRGLPWYFWSNDDDDSGETDGTDIPGKGTNSGDGVVNGVRDLVDFFPVHLDIAGLLRDYPADDPTVTYKLAQADGAANFLTTELTPLTVGDDQRDASVAGTLGSASVIPITAEGVALDRTFLGKIITQGKGIILVEACKATTAPLRLEVWHNNAFVSKIELPLRFAGVEQMFRHKNLVSAVNMQPDTADRDGAPNWPDELNNGKAFVFVHGYNVNQQQARGWQAEVFKRLWWSGSRAQFWGVTWYGSESQITLGNSHLTGNYQINVVHALGTAPILADFISTLKTSGGFAKINVAGHSLGNMVVSSAISDHQAPVDRYFMLDAAVAAEAYDGAQDSQVAQPDDGTAFLPHTEWNKEFDGVYPPKLWASNWHKLFPTPSGNPATDDARATLTWRDRFAPQPTTAYYDFHSTGEEVLGYDETHTKNTPSLAGVLASELKTYLHITLSNSSGQPNGYQTWLYQEQLKGRTITGKILGSNFGGWGFNIFHFKKQPGVPGRGPVLAPVVLTPSEAETLLPVFTDEVLREEPFFRPGGFWTKVGTWQYDLVAKTNSWNSEPLRQLYNPTTGSGFASRHRDALLARMIPAMSPAAGRIPVAVLTPANSPSRNFDMNGTTFRGDTATPPWPASRNGDTRWRHSDLRTVAYPYVRKLYEQLKELGNLGQAAP